MTFENIEIGFVSGGWRKDLDLFLAEMAPGMNGYILSRARLASVARLYNLSDEDLAKMELARTDIPAFVFADILPG